eukprot:365649_1
MQMLFLCLSWLLLSFHQIQSHPAINIQPRIVNGYATKQSQYPFVAAIRSIETDTNGNSYMSGARCGGSIIRKSHPAAILTAAHCVFNSTNTMIIELNTSSTQSQSQLGVTAWPVMFAVTHEQFDRYTLNNDIALIFIDVDLTLRNDLYISSIKIPNLEVNPSIECCNDSDILQIIGYGRTSFGSVSSKTIEYTNLQYLDRTNCNTKLCRWETGKKNCRWTYVNDNSICAIGDFSTPCHGDSGGPLLKINTQIQVGIVSWGMLCINTLPTVFTNTGLYYTWVRSKLSQFVPTSIPSVIPTIYPTKYPTEYPTKYPTEYPTKYPTEYPTKYPT